MPEETGDWTYSTDCSDANNSGLNGQKGIFHCGDVTADNRFAKYGPVRLSSDRHSLTHADGTPFFWLADTAWNGALLSTPADWDFYLRERVRQKFTAVQWVATQWRAAPNGDRENQTAYTGREKIAVNPAFFQRLDAKADAVNRAGLLNAIVMLWAIQGGSNPQVNPGVSLPEDQATLLAQYMIARWGANDVVWILAGDGDYRGPRAERWKRMGRAVFGSRPHAPVTLHPGGMQWILNDFIQEPWYDIVGYQSGHGDDDNTLRWLIEGPVTTDWKKDPPRPFINLEPPYENHIAYQSHTPISATMTRRAIYWSLLETPTAGVTYGGHGVWGWDDGTKPPTDHPGAGVPLPWQKALVMPGAEQMAYVRDLFTGIDFWRLRPAPNLLVVQPGHKNPRQHIAAARTETGDLAVIYVPEDRMVEVRFSLMPPGVKASWFNPRTGQNAPVVAVVNADSVQFATPTEGDWVLTLKSKK